MAIVSASAGRFRRLNRLVQFWRTRGTTSTIYLIVRRFVQAGPWEKWLQFCLSDIFRVSVEDLKVKNRIPSVFDVRIAGDDDTASLENFFDSNDSQLVRTRMLRGDVCVVTICASEICAGVWFVPGPKDFGEDWEALGCSFSVPEGACLTYDGRGKKMGAWGCLMGRFPTFLKEMGISQVYTVIDLDKGLSIDSHKSLGYKTVGQVGNIGAKLLSFRLYKTTRHGWRFMPGRIETLGFTDCRSDQSNAAMARSTAACGPCK